MRMHIILMEDPIVDQLWTFSTDVHEQLLEDCCIIFAVNSLLGRTDVLINHPCTVEKHHQSALSLCFLLLNFLMFLLPFSQPRPTFMFEFRIVAVNPQFVDSDHSFTIT